jgi:hypothetical protein
MTIMVFINIMEQSPRGGGSRKQRGMTGKVHRMERR